MKTLQLSIIAILIPLTIGTSYAIPSGSPPFEFGLELDKVLYKPGDTIMIHVWGAGAAPANSTVYLKILDATSYISGTIVVYQDVKNLVNNDVRFNYTIPVSQDTSNSTYRFLVQVYQNPDDLQPLNGVYFVTRDGAQRLAISTVNILTPMAKPGQLINFTAGVTDGLGYIIPDIHVAGDLPQTNGGMDYLSAGATYDNSTKLFTGSIQVPQSWNNYPQQNGTYYLRITANPPYLGPPPMINDYSNKGIIPVENRSSTVQIVVENPYKNNPPAIITQVELSSPFALYPDNQTCTFPPMPGFINNCLTNLVPGHKVQCGFFIGSNTCEPIRQYTSGTNQSCFSDYPASGAPQWFDVYNTLNTTIHLQNFTVIEKWNQGPYGKIGPYSTVMEVKPNEKCTVPIEPIDEPLAMYLNNMSMEITYHYSGKDYNITTPSFSDIYNDTRTWQYDGDKWIFAEQNTVTVPEFPLAIPVLMASIASLIVFYRMKFR